MKQHLIQIGKVFGHFLCDLIIHKFSDPAALLFDFLVWLTNDDRLDWAT